MTCKSYCTLEYFLQEKGECGDYCYVINGKVRVVLEHGEEYRDPDQPCDVYSCIVSILAWIYVISNDYVKCSTNLLWCHCNNNYVYFTGT